MAGRMQVWVWVAVCMRVWVNGCVGVSVGVEVRGGGVGAGVRGLSFFVCF